MLDENKWLAARHGLEGELVDLPERKMVASKELARRLYDRLREHAQDLGGADELEGILDLLEKGTGAARQRVVYEANHDWGELLREIVAVAGTELADRAVATPVAARRRRIAERAWQAALTCSSCAAAAGARCRPYITECPYCGNRLRKRAPKLERGGTPKPPKARAQAARRWGA